MGRIDDIHTALRLQKNRKKLKYIFIAILRIAESLKIIKWHNPAQPNPNVTLFDDLFLGKY